MCTIIIMAEGKLLITIARISKRVSLASSLRFLYKLVAVVLRV